MIGLMMLAGVMTGADLKNYCLGNPVDKLICTSYVNGASDVLMIAQRGEHRLFCAPEGVTELQLTDVVAKWLKAHPDTGIRTAARVVFEALHDGYPCSQ